MTQFKVLCIMHNMHQIIYYKTLKQELKHIFKNYRNTWKGDQGVNASSVFSQALDDVRPNIRLHCQACRHGLKCRYNVFIQSQWESRPLTSTRTPGVYMTSTSNTIFS